MFTINLEKELLKQPASKVSAEELLLIKEYDRLGADVSNSEVLSRIGINKAAATGKELSERNDKLLRSASGFNLDKVFHISQIEKLCDRYYLRFLPSALFKGSIDPSLPDKIATFEATYNVQCKSVVKDISRFRNWMDIEAEKGNNTFIAAPASSFKLEERPKDPLLFYKINDEYYYLIHKWGNDLSIIRRFYKILSSRLLAWAILIPSIIYCFFNVGNLDAPNPPVSNVVFFIIGIVFSVLAIMNLVFAEDGFRFLPENRIKSRYL